MPYTKRSDEEIASAWITEIGRVCDDEELSITLDHAYFEFDEVHTFREAVEELQAGRQGDGLAWDMLVDGVKLYAIENQVDPLEAITQMADEFSQVIDAFDL